MQTRAASAMPAPQPVLRVVDAVALIVGIVVGAGIFRTPSLVAANASSTNTCAGVGPGRWRIARGRCVMPN